MHIGFTGTRSPLTSLQTSKLIREMQMISFYKGFRTGLAAPTLHHGDCLGADEFADQVAQELGWLIDIHPPVDEKDRAFCNGPRTSVREPLTYMKRNQVIVDCSDVLLAVPPTNEEQKRGGTWSTWRKGVKAGIPTVLFLPTIGVKRETHG